MRRIVYLGGLGREPGLSRHLRSRQEVGRILRESGVPTIELRASIVIGSGSLSFEMVRALVQKLPVMITPRWVSQPAQPIAIEDLVAYLVSAADVDLSESAVVEIGGADRVSYVDIMREYARQRGLRRCHDPRAGAEPAALQPLAGPGDARLRPRRPGADRQHPEHHDRGGRLRPPALPRRAAPRHPRGDRPRPAERGPGVRGDPLVRRPLLGRRPAAVGGRRLRVPHRRLAVGAGSTGAPRGLRADPSDRRRRRLVLRELALAAPGLPRSARRRGGGAARTTRPGAPRARRRPRLLAGRGDRAGPRSCASPPR